MTTSHPDIAADKVAKERPILFSGSMVRALLAGSKTQTRRVVKLANGQYIPPSKRADVNGWNQLLRNCPYGEPGHRLWVRESFAHIYSDNKVPASRRPEDVAYMADPMTPDADVYGPWKPSIHMPRWASRILLEITEVRVERLQDISEADAEAEGADPLTWDGNAGPADLIDWPLKEAAHPYRNGYALLWDSINGDDAWAANPWVWAVSFRIVSPITTPSAKEAS